MKIIILGAGQVGISTAEILAKEDNDITLIDNVASQVEGLQDRLDIRTIVGSASHPSCLLYTSPSPRDRQKSRMPSSA